VGPFDFFTPVTTEVIPLSRERRGILPLKMKSNINRTFTGVVRDKATEPVANMQNELKHGEIIKKRRSG
jgi:hypothetical protein